MNFETAVEIAQAMETAYPTLLVAGYRRTSFERPMDSWALDIVNALTGKMIALDEKDDWQVRIRELLPAEDSPGINPATVQASGHEQPHRQ